MWFEKVTSARRRKSVPKQPDFKNKRGGIMRVSRYSMIAVGLLSAGAHLAAAQSYPTRPIRIVTTQVGGGNDVIARLIAPALTKSLGQQVVIDNRPSGPIAPQVASKSTPRGHAIWIACSSFWIGPLLQEMSCDAIKDFEPVTITSEVTNVLVVSNSLPV